jgi:hypothetical protein
VPGGFSQVRANGADPKQTDGFPAQGSGQVGLPSGLFLGFKTLKNFAFMQKQITKYIFGHQAPENTTRVGQDVIPSEVWPEQRFHTCPGSLDPLESGKIWKNIMDEGWFPKNQFNCRFNGIHNFKTGKMRGSELVNVCLPISILRQEKKFGHGCLFTTLYDSGCFRRSNFRAHSQLVNVHDDS